jgi:serine/threonine protein phosphatase 1
MRDPEDEIVRIDVKGPVAVIGDIHGRSDLLKLLLKKLGKTMPVFFVGDLVDRGPDAFGVIEVLMARKARGIRGNHEEWLRKWFAGEGFNGDVLQRAFGAGATLASYGIAPGEPYGPRYVEVPPAHRRFINELPLVLDLTVDGKPYWVIHTGVHKGTPLEPGTPPDEAVAWLVENEPYDLLWNGGFIEDARRLDRPVIFGHKPHTKPAATTRAIAIDTGCGTWESGKLTAVVLPEQRFVSVP